MASKQKKRISKIEYLFQKRVETLAAHLKRYVLWGLEDVDTEHSKYLVYVNSTTDHLHQAFRDEFGHESQRSNELKYAREARQAEHSTEQNLITNVIKNKFKHEKKGNFKQDHPDTKQTVITITVAESPGSLDHEPGSILTTKAIEQIKKGLAKEVESEVGSMIQQVDVESQVNQANKQLATLHYSNTPIMKKYQYAVFAISFVWNEVADTTVEKFNAHEKIGKRKSLVDERVAKLAEVVTQRAKDLNIPIEEFIRLMDAEL